MYSRHYSDGDDAGSATADHFAKLNHLEKWNYYGSGSGVKSLLKAMMALKIASALTASP